MNPIEAIKESIAKHLAKAQLGNDVEIGVAAAEALHRSSFGLGSRLERIRAYKFGEQAIREYIKLLQEKIDNGNL